MNEEALESVRLSCFFRKHIRLLVFSAGMAAMGVSEGRANALIDQTLDLQPGWNAVYLDVDPVESSPASLFADTPVDVVAAHDAPIRGAQFVVNPSADMLSTFGWSVWYAPGRQDAFLTTLFAIQGGRPYLIHARTNVSLTLTGSIPPAKVAWTPDAYNFVGFSVASPDAPTFHQFFQGSPAHNHNQLYRLVEGTWRQVLNPAQDVMRAGEAFWIYCRGRSDYPGPLEVSMRWGLVLNLTSESGGDIMFRNRTVHPVSFTLEHIVDPALPIPLSTPVSVQEEEFGRIETAYIHYETDAFVQALPALEAGEAIRLPFALRVRDAGPGERFSLLKITTDLGTISYVPVTAQRTDL